MTDVNIRLVRLAHVHSAARAHREAERLQTHPHFNIGVNCSFKSSETSLDQKQKSSEDENLTGG